MKTASGGVTVVQPVTRPTIHEPAKPTATPRRPPSMLIATLSTRNCVSTSEPRAPMAMRMPISRVRSVTETSMMFMMPMPPTSRETPAMLPSKIVMMLLVWLAASATSDMLRRGKASGGEGGGRGGGVGGGRWGWELVAGARGFCYLRLRRVGRFCRDRRGVGHLHARRAEDFFLHGGVRRERRVVLVAPLRVLTSAR